MDYKKTSKDNEIFINTDSEDILEKLNPIKFDWD